MFWRSSAKGMVIFVARLFASLVRGASSWFFNFKRTNWLAFPNINRWTTLEHVEVFKFGYLYFLLAVAVAVVSGSLAVFPALLGIVHVSTIKHRLPKGTAWRCEVAVSLAPAMAKLAHQILSPMTKWLNGSKWLNIFKRITVYWTLWSYALQIVKHVLHPHPIPGEGPSSKSSISRSIWLQFLLDLFEVGYSGLNRSTRHKK